MRAVFCALTTLELCFCLPVVYGIEPEPRVASVVDSQPPSQRDLAYDAVKRLTEADNWREVAAIQKEFAEFGEEAVHPLWRQAKRCEDEAVRLRCFEVLTRYFGKQAEERIAHDGLSDESDKVRYHCAWYVGDLKIYGGHRSLRRLMEDEKQPESVRHAATKSLAQLGEADVIRQLAAMMESDYYMPRYMGNLGAKALTGKNLNDFNGYEYSEGAVVSGGIEYRLLNVHPVGYHETLAKRHQAIADYCKWLESERPAIFKHLYAPW
jgi:hypothetical protein